MTWSVASPPIGLTVNPSSGLVQWQPLEAQVGTQTVDLRVTDPGGLSAIQTIVITVNPSNYAPQVSAIPDQTVDVASRAKLFGPVFDDGKPLGSQVGFGWSKVSGPGTVTFLSPTSGDTDASFGLPGEYVLRLTATDTVLSGSDDVTVTVTGAAPPTISAMAPSSGPQGGSGPVVITGLSTNFIQGTSQVSLGVGITVNSVTVSGPTSLTAQVTIQDTAVIGTRTVTVTTGAEVASLASGFSVTAGTPLIQSFNPVSAVQGQSVTLTVNDKFTNFAPGTSQVTLGSGITVSNVAVASSTSLTAQVNIGLAATPGTRTLTVTTGAETVSVAGVFTVLQAIPILYSLTPGGGTQGQQNLAIAIVGQNTNFVQGTTQATFGAGVTVTAVTVSSPTTATAVVNIISTAAVGTRTVSVTTNAETAIFTNGFTVVAATPTLTQLNPGGGQPGQQNLSVAITGFGTNFMQGTTQAGFGAGITVVSVTVASATIATAVINIGSTAAIGPRTVTMTTGSEVAAFPNGFAVSAGTPVLTEISPGGGTQGQQNLAVTVKGFNTRFVQGTTQVAFGGTGVTVNSVTVTNATSVTANISIAATAALGDRGITITTGPEVASYANAFTIQQGIPAVITVTPNSGSQGQQNLNVVITGLFTNFVQGTSQVSFAGTAVTVNSVTVISATSLTANISIATNAAAAPRSVTVTTGGQVATLANAFVVNTGVNQPPVITIAPTWSITLPNRLALDYTVTDDRLPSGGALTVSWEKISGPGNVGFLNQTPTSISVGFDQAGTYSLRITATDTQFTASNDISVTVQPAGAPATVSIASPIDGAEITTRVPVMGTVSGASLASWVLEYRPEKETAFRTLATGTTAVANGVLGTFDPTLLLNGIVFLQLRAIDQGGQSTTAGPIALTLTKNQKIGNFTVSFNDMTVPMPGMSIQIVRTYDSRNRAPGDFGYGWTLDIQNVRTAENRIMGTQWQGTTTGGLLPNYCIQPVKPHIVTITLPDNTTYRFQPSLTPQCQQLVPPSQVTFGFSAMTGTVASLAAVGNKLAEVSGAFPGNFDLLDSDTLQPFDPAQYQLTLPDGRVLLLDKAKGLQSMTDLSGNKLTITAGGVQHTSGKSIVFTRDTATQNITKITDPAGNFVSYSASLTTGDLTSVTDRENLTTNYTYDATHGLLTIKDPRGIQPIRNEYDASGRLIRHIDAFGKAIEYNHSFATNQEIVTDRLGSVTVNEYDADGNVVKVTDANGGITTRTYDSRGNMLSEIDPLTRTRTFVYDAQDNRTSETDALANTTSYTYNSRRQVFTITDPLGRVTTNVYDASGNLTSTKDPSNQTTAFSYNSRGQQTSATDPLANVTQNQYDASGNLTQTTDALSNVTTFTYDANGNRLSESRTRTVSSVSETLLTSYTYDKSNRLTKTTLPDGTTTQVVYNNIGKQASTIDQLNRTTSYTYDEMGRPTQTTFPDGTTEKSSYDAEGRRTSSIDRLNRTTSFTYDALGRLTKTTFADSATTSTQYDIAGQATQSTDARGNLTKYFYDNAGRRTQVKDALNNTTVFAYDKVGNQTSMTDANGTITQYLYDPNNRRTRVTYPDATFDLTGYDALGRTISKTDQAGKLTQYQFDKLGRLTQVTDALNQVTKYTYDEVGNRLMQTDARNNTTSFTYDKRGRRTRRTLPLTMFETMQYDAAGKMVKRTDFNGKTTSFASDSMNLLTSKTPDPTLSEPTISFTYTSTGQRSSIVDSSGTTTYLYDSRDRLTTKVTPQGTLTYTYDLAGNLATIRSSNAGGTSVDYAYDALNRLSQVTDNRLTGNKVTTYTFDKAGNLAGYAYPNGVQHSYTYNSLNRLSNLAVAKGATTLASYAYTLGPSGNRTAVAEFGGRQVSYEYDPLYRLTKETIAGATINGVIGYLYDTVGNRLSRTSTVAPVAPSTATYDANDRLTSDTYDSNGSTTASGANNYTYDFEARLKTMNGNSVTMVYDGDGNRVSKTAAGTTTRYLVDDRNLTGYAQVLEELGGGAVQRVYTYGLNRISQSQASGATFYGYDGHGSVRLLTDGPGALTDRYEYDAFGIVTDQTGVTPNVYLYSGEQNDSSVGLYYLRARFLSVAVGRFLTGDAFAGDPQSPLSLHKYLYVGSNPVNRLDPSGYLSLPQLTA